MREQITYLNVIVDYQDLRFVVVHASEYTRGNGPAEEFGNKMLQKRFL